LASHTDFKGFNAVFLAQSLAERENGAASEVKTRVIKVAIPRGCIALVTVPRFIPFRAVNTLPKDALPR
jgi:hypothetical protein